MSEQDGGPAFPQVESEGAEDGIGGHHYSHVYSYGGMSLRDYFAARAISAPWAQGISLHDGTATAEGIEELAVNCYALADAMLKARAA